METELEELREHFIEELQGIIVEHIQKENIGPDDPEQSVILDIAARKFPSISGNLMKKLEASQDIKLRLDKKFLKENQYGLNEVFVNDEIRLNNLDFREYMEVTRRVLLGRSMNADKHTESGCCHPGWRISGIPMWELQRVSRPDFVKNNCNQCG